MATTKQYLDEHGLKTFWTKIKGKLDEKADKDDIADAYRVMGSKTVAQINSLSGMNVGDVYNVTTAGKIGNVNVKIGDNVVWTGTEWDPLGGVYENATSTTAGLMPAADKDKLDKFVQHKTGKQITNGFVKITTDAYGHITQTAAVGTGDITALGVPSKTEVDTLIKNADDAILQKLNYSKSFGYVTSITQTDGLVSATGEAKSTEVASTDQKLVTGQAVYNVIDGDAMRPIDDSYINGLN